MAGELMAFGIVAAVATYFFNVLIEEIFNQRRRLNELTEAINNAIGVLDCDDSEPPAPECGQSEPPLVASPAEMDAILLEYIKRHPPTEGILVPGSERETPANSPSGVRTSVPQASGIVSSPVQPPTVVT